jgi:hypothetical protein
MWSASPIAYCLAQRTTRTPVKLNVLDGAQLALRSMIQRITRFHQGILCQSNTRRPASVQMLSAHPPRLRVKTRL